MIAPLIWKGVLKLVQIRRDSNKNTNVARVYNPREQTPEAIFVEIAPNCYEDSLTGDLFKVLNNKMVAI